MFSLCKKFSTFLATAVFLTVALYTPYQAAQINTKHAFAGGAAGGATEATQILNNAELAVIAVKDTITAAASKIISWATGNLWFKENVLDGLAWTVAKALLSQFTQSIVNWINNGFEGSPAFVTDLRGFLLDVADQAAGEYINDYLGLGFLCEPFELDIRIALSIQYNQARDFQPPECTLTDIVDNVEGFLAGDFSQGGWEGWLEMTQRPQNTPYGGYLYSSLEFDAFVAGAQNEQSTLLDFGNGFLSSTICFPVDGKTREDCIISNPGKVIETQLNEALGLPQDTLVVADEFNEIIGALFNQLAQQAISGAGGLLGLSGGTGYTDYSYAGTGVNVPYADAVAQENQGTTVGGSEINEAIRRTNEWIQYQQYVINYINSLDNTDRNYKAEMDELIFGCYSLQLGGTLRNKRTSAQNEIVAAQSTLITLQELQTRLDNVEDTATALNSDNDSSNNTTIAELQADIFNELQLLVSTGVVPSQVDIELIEQIDRQQFSDDVGNAQTRMTNERNRCITADNNSTNNASGNSADRGR